MRPSAFIANTLWAASNTGAHSRFRRALAKPEAAQTAKLRSITQGATYQEFTNRVPISTYADIEPAIARIQAGEQNVLGCDRVTHLIPTSGTSSARKLIPFTNSLQQEFNEAIGAWMFDLCGHYPGILGGRAYWSITPVLATGQNPPSKIPIGFDADLNYLAPHKRALAAATMAVPPPAGAHQSLEEFHFQTWRHLLRCRDLRLISVWHPSFLTLLLDSLPILWKDLCKEAPRCDPHDPKTFWPNLRLISCWGDAAAAVPLANLQKRFPEIPIQPKGLIATECFVSIPFQNLYPLAITSHFFEFLDASGKVHRAHELQQGEEYEVIVTTGAGLSRYRLGDHIRVNGFLGKTPSIQFIGRGNSVSDLCGEKLSEQFVTRVLTKLFARTPPTFAMLAPDEQGYSLYLESTNLQITGNDLDSALRENPHYAYCRDLGQLLPPKIVSVSRAFDKFAAYESQNGARLGDIKPRSLSPKTGWTKIFTDAQTASHVS